MATLPSLSPKATEMEGAGSAYVRVVEDTPERLRLVRVPGTLSVALAAGCLCLAVGSWLWLDLSNSLNQVALGLAFLALANEFAEPWQSCTITKPHCIVIERQPYLSWVLGLSTKRWSFDVPVTGVFVHSEVLRYCSMGHQVVLDLENGRQLGVTVTCTIQDQRHHEVIATKVGSFLGVPCKLPEKPPPLPPGFAGTLERILRQRFRGVPSAEAKAE